MVATAATAAAAGIVALLVACGEVDGPPDAAGPVAGSLHFTDVTAQSGVDISITSGHVPASQILEVKGGGLALIDYDGDGDLDLFVPNGATLDAPDRGPGCRLYENLSSDGGGLAFADVTAAAGLEFARWGMGVAVGDVDGDGHDDLYVTCFGPNALLRNTGEGRFEDVTAAAGVGDDRWGTGCSFGDVDGDGDLDLYVVNYVDFDPTDPPAGSTFMGVTVFGGPLELPALADVLYINRGDGTFEDRSEAWGCDAVEPAYGLGAVILDFDGDGRQEVFVGNDSMANFLFDDAGPAGAEGAEAAGAARRLVDQGRLAGIAANMEGAYQATMGIAIGDVDGDGRPDVFTTNFAGDSNTLHRNLDGRFFDDRTSQYGLAAISRPFLGWAAAFHDFDLDGDEDLVVFNGHVYPHASLESMNSEARQPPLLFAREGARFAAVAAESAGPWLAEPHVDRSAAFGDLDGDGDVDMVVGELNGPVRVLRNDAVGHWLTVQLEDLRPGVGNRRGLGSRIRLEIGDSVQYRWIFSGGSFQSASTQAAHFGVPLQAGPLEVEVLWPDGFVQRVSVDAADQELVITRR